MAQRLNQGVIGSEVRAMKHSIAIVAGLLIGAGASLSSVSAAPIDAATPMADGKAKKTVKTTVKKKDDAEQAPSQLEDGGDDGGATLTVSCWCSGGANGNGYASCLGDSCDSANSCCAAAYGDGSTASD